MHRRHVQRILAVADAQEAGGLFEGLRAEARHRHQFHARAERPCSLRYSMIFTRGALRDARHIAQQRPRCGVQIHADAVDAAFHRGFQALL